MSAPLADERASEVIDALMVPLSRKRRCGPIEHPESHCLPFP